MFAEPEARGGEGERCSADDVGAHAREVSFTSQREHPEQLIGNDHADDRIAEKFETLIGSRSGIGFVQVGSVRKRLAEQVFRQRLYAEPRHEFFVGRRRSQLHRTSRENEWIGARIHRNC